MREIMSFRSALVSLGIALAIVTLFSVALESLSAASESPTFHLDGAFQTASVLFRISNGELPGRDFFPYLGVGPNVLVYSIFAISGGDLAASVFSAKFITMASGLASLVVLCQLIVKPCRFVYSIVGAVLLFCLIKLARENVAYFEYLSFLFDPGNSLRPVRSFIPYLACGIYMMSIAYLSEATARAIVMSLLLALVLTWSNDYALTTALLLACVYFIDLIVERGRHPVITVLFTVTSAILIYMAAMMIITAGHLSDLLRYNFVSVANDQWWYYMSHSGAPRVYGIGDVVLVANAMGYATLVVWLGTVLGAFLVRTPESRLMAFVGTCLAAGGIAASLGGFPQGGYFAALKCWATAVVALMGVSLFVRQAGKVKLHRVSLLVVGRRVVLASAILASATVFFLAFQSHNRALASMRGNGRVVVVPELGGTLDQSWSDYVSFVRANKDAKVFEEYSGIWNAITRGSSSFLPVDSTIHALGATRGVVQAGLKDADFITTTRYNFAPFWQPWGVVRNYWLYSVLFSGFRPVMASPGVIVWAPLDRPRGFSDVGCKAFEDGSGFQLNTDSSGIFEVVLSYDITKAGRFLAVVETGITNGLDQRGRISVDPNAHQAVLPVEVVTGEEPFFRAMVFGSKKAELRINSCSARQLNLEDIDPEFQLMLFGRPSMTPFNLTDVNWVNGVARSWAGVFVEASPNNEEFFKVGRSIRFRDGDVRQIKRTMRYQKFLNLYFDGTPLNGSVVGYPHQFEVVN
jgi:hypothetical protein